MAEHIVTFAPPTPNGGLHIGHLSGSFLAADIYTRTFLLLGDLVTFVSYSDDHQSYLARKAEELQVDKSSLALSNADKIRETLKRYHIKPDVFFSSYNDPDFISSAAMFRNAIGEHISLKEDLVPWCRSCKRWGFEAYARGECNVCYSDSDRSQCENCATAPEITGLSHVRCTGCGKVAEIRAVLREFIDLSFYQDFYRALSIRPGIRKPLQKYLKHSANLSNLNWPIDRPEEHGIPCDEAPGKLLSTWFCGVSGYHAATSKLEKEHLWKDADHCAFFVGYDCSFSHAIVYPALMKAAGMTAVDNLRIYTNAFLKLEGRDLSTSRGVAVWADDLQKLVNSDYIRLYLAHCSPETEVSDFSVNAFHQCVTEEIHQPLNRIYDRVLASGSPPGGQVTQALLWLEHWHSAICVEHHSMKKLATLLIEWLAEAAEHDNASELPSLLLAWSILAAPVMPALSENILSNAGLTDKHAKDWLTGKNTYLPEGRAFSCKPWFVKSFSVSLDDLKSLSL